MLLSDFQYDLPDERIARFPLSERDQSKLLVYKHGQINHVRFYNLIDHLRKSCMLVFNNTKVIPARLLIQKPTGAVVEVFLLHPLAPTPVISMAMEVQGDCTWSCMIGNVKRWKEGETFSVVVNLANKEVCLQATLVSKADSTVRFTWNENIPFVDIVQVAGQIPLPPYLKRAVTENDTVQYQTVYSEKKGAVAAPTAGLHFTEKVLADLTEAGIRQEFITLHVGAGTFQPIKTDHVAEHKMHAEQVVFTTKNIEALLQNIGAIMPVGTTSMRSLESLYWLGVYLQLNPEASANNFFIDKTFAYQHQEENLPTPSESLSLIAQRMERDNLTQIVGETAIMIMPGYQFRICKGIITNFHQPGSTLILLIAALLGDNWRKVYEEALANDYRFLSFGDSSLLMP
jgi:S-adenosylmethionine:tRNA ribosyltransferase-isomerase